MNAFHENLITNIRDDFDKIAILYFFLKAHTLKFKMKKIPREIWSKHEHVPNFIKTSLRVRAIKHCETFGLRGVQN